MVREGAPPGLRRGSAPHPGLQGAPPPIKDIMIKNLIKF